MSDGNALGEGRKKKGEGGKCKGKPRYMGCLLMVVGAGTLHIQPRGGIPIRELNQRRQCNHESDPSTRHWEGAIERRKRRWQRVGMGSRKTEFKKSDKWN
jgi:hypothetical protein